MNTKAVVLVQLVLTLLPTHFAQASGDPVTCVLLPLERDPTWGTNDDVSLNDVALVMKHIHTEIGALGNVSLRDSKKVLESLATRELGNHHEPWTKESASRAAETLEADLVVYGTINPFFENYTVHLFLVEVKHAAILNRLTVDIAKKVDDSAEKKLIQAARELFDIPSFRYLPFKPRYQSATLHWDDTAEEPTSIDEPRAELDTYQASGFEIAVFREKVTGTAAGASKPAWTLEASKETCLQLLEHGHGVLYLRQWKRRGEQEGRKESYEPEQPLRIHRISEEQGEWLPALDVGPSDPSSDGPDTLLNVLPLPNGAVVVAVKAGGWSTHERPIDSYEIDFFDGSSGKLVWRKQRASEGDVSSPGYALLSPGGPRYAESELVHSQVVGNKLIVCAGAGESILCLRLEDGDEIWRLPAIWEYRRGFIGPSTWRHFVGRFGDHDAEGLFDGTGLQGAIDADYKKSLERKLEAFKDERPKWRERCRIVGGPLVVPTGDDFRLFVAVAESPDRGGGYVSDCLIYEVRSNGVPTSLLTMPRMVIGSDYRILKDGVLWRCQQSAMARLGVSAEPESSFGPFGGSDCIGRLVWYRQFLPEAMQEEKGPEDARVWLTTAVAGEPLWFDTHAMLTVPAGGYIVRRGDQVFHFPIRLFDLTTAKETKFILSVPFDGVVSPPTTNYSEMDSTFSTDGPYYLAVTDLALKDGQITIALTHAETETKEISFAFQGGPGGQGIGVQPTK